MYVSLESKKEVAEKPTQNPLGVFSLRLLKNVQFCPSTRKAIIKT